MDVIIDWNLGNMIYHGLITLQLCGFSLRGNWGCFIYALDIAYRAHVGDDRDFFAVGFDAALGHDVSEQLPL